MHLHRRQFVRALATLGLASVARSLIGCRSSNRLVARPIAAAEAARPRHLVFFHLRGGIDSILTTGPKRSADLDANVDLPYSATDIFSVNGKDYGPQLRPLEHHLGEAAILNGIYTGSVQHDYGGAQLLRMKMRVTFDVPTIAQVVGDHLKQNPLGSVALGQVDPEGGFYPPGLLQCTSKEQDPRTRDLCDDVIDMTPEELRLAADGLDQLAVSPEVGPEVLRSSHSMAALMRRLAAGVPKQSDELWLPEIPPEQRSVSFKRPRRAIFERDCQRALWMLENELVTCIHIQPRGIMWDSHTNNLETQTKMNAAFFPVLARFLDELKVRKNSHGSLASQTMVVAGSELGRLPRLNNRAGKDHFPELPMMFFGPRVKTASKEGPGVVVGALGRRMESLPIDVMTGRPSATGSRPSLNDIGATVLTAFGVPPKAYGYDGQPLHFLMDV